MADRKLKDRVALIGVELEGGWAIRPPSGAEIIRDGSVKISDDAVRALKIKSIGEIVSPPMKRELVEQWVKEHYPQIANETCGLHVHMSFKYPLHYMQLMTPKFTDAMVRALATWSIAKGLPKEHPLCKRILNPNHQHCAQLYLGDNQVYSDHKDYHSRGKPHSRYTAINYCFKMHKTVECRLLPMFAVADEAVEAVNVVLDTTNKFLSKIRLKEPRFAARVALKSNMRTIYRSTV